MESVQRLPASGNLIGNQSFIFLAWLFQWERKQDWGKIKLDKDLGKNDKRSFVLQ